MSAIRPARLDPEQRPAPRLSGSNIRLHGGVLVGICVCLAAGWFELTRARGGREVAWVYVVEWPMFAVFGVYIWWRLWHEQRSAAGPPDWSRAADEAGVTHTVPSDREEADPTRDDPQLAAWQRYLRNLHAADPPGAPPNQGR